MVQIVALTIILSGSNRNNGSANGNSTNGNRNGNNGSKNKTAQIVA